MFRERDNFVRFSENIKYVHLKKNMVIYHKEGKRVTIGLVYMIKTILSLSQPGLHAYIP